jgi:hypothetical protein
MGPWERTSRDNLKDRWLQSNIPTQVPISASIFLQPHLANRSYIFSTDNLEMVKDKVEFAIPDALFDFIIVIENGRIGGVTYDQPAIRDLLRSSEFGLVESQDGLLLFKNNPKDIEVLINKVEVQAVDKVTPNLANFHEKIGLIDYSVQPVDGGRLQFTFIWVALDTLEKEPLKFAVTRAKAVENSRFIHLPTYVLQPTVNWQAGMVIREEFESRWSADIPSGDYPLFVSWYDSSSHFAALTDARSRLGEEYLLGIIKWNKEKRELVFMRKE